VKHTQNFCEITELCGQVILKRNPAWAFFLSKRKPEKKKKAVTLSINL